MCSDEIAHCVTGVRAKNESLVVYQKLLHRTKKTSIICYVHWRFLFSSFRIISTHTDNSNIKIRLDSLYKKFKTNG